MPTKRTAWACEFGCGRNVLTSKQRMAHHESRCLWNPIRMACVTCAKFATYHDSNGMGHEPQHLEEWRVNECHEGHDIDEKLRCDCADHQNK